MGERVAHEVHPATLPAGVHHLGDRGFYSLVGVGDDELDAAQAAPPELAQKIGPEGFGFRRADVHAEHLAPSVVVDADSDDHGHRDDAAVLADFDVSRVDPDIGPIAFDRAIEKGFDLFVDLLAEPADLALGDAGAAHGFDEIVDGAGRDALHIGLLDHRRQRLLGHAARLEEAGEIGSLAELGNAQLHRSSARLPVAIPIAVALGHAIGRALAERGAGLRADLQLHQPLGGEADHLAKEIGVGGLSQKRPQAHHLVGHRWVPRLR